MTILARIGLACSSVVLLIGIGACSDGDAHNMCYRMTDEALVPSVNGQSVILQCRPESDGDCGADGMQHLGSYDQGTTCWDDIGNVLTAFADSGEVAPGEFSSERQSGNPGVPGDPGGGGGGSCPGDYQGPYYPEIYIEAQCQNIWLHGCAQEVVDLSCQILDQYATNGVPNVCPYCR